MKSTIWRAALITCLLIPGFSLERVAEAAEWPSKCSQYGALKPNTNPSPQQLNCMLTNAAIEAKIPPEVVKAVAEQESSWIQFKDGKPLVSADGGIGIMQLTNQSGYDDEKLKTDITYNIQAGVEVLAGMFRRTDLPKIKGAGGDVIENWYFPVMAYNGIKPVNSPLFQSDGTRNMTAYQEKVFVKIKEASFLGSENLAVFPFNRADFAYDPASDQNIVFNKLLYALSGKMHSSRYGYVAGNKVVVTGDNVNLRSGPGSSFASVKLVPKGTSLIISGAFLFDKNIGSSNKFVWYPVKTVDQKLSGYIASAYITRQLDAPQVTQVDDNDKVVAGKAPAGTIVRIMRGSTLIGSTTADAYGQFKVSIPVQKAGVQLTVNFKNNLNEVSPSRNLIVLDKTPPGIPSVNTVSNKAAQVTGKTEKYATVTVKIATKSYTAKADAYGNFKVAIPIQNAYTSLAVTAKDSAGNTSGARTIKVVRVAPNLPIVNAVKYYSTAVTGKTEKYAVVTVKIGTNPYSAKANAYGNFKISIQKQRAGTKLYVTAKDAKGNVSATRTVTVLK